MNRRAFMLASAAALAAPIALAADGVIDAERAAKMAEAGEILLVDIRTPAEWAASGVPAPARAVTMHAPGVVARLKAAMAEAPGRPLALICASGGRSRWLKGELAKAGIGDVLDVSEGMFGSPAGPGWLKRGLPVRPCGADCGE